MASPSPGSTSTGTPPPSRRNSAARSRRGSPTGTVRQTEQRPEPATTTGFRPTARGRVKRADINAAGHFALGAIVHRFSNASNQLGAAIGMDAAFLQQQRRGFSTFELILHLSAALPLDAPYRGGNRYRASRQFVAAHDPSHDRPTHRRRGRAAQPVRRQPRPRRAPPGPLARRDPQPSGGARRAGWPEACPKRPRALTYAWPSGRGTSPCISVTSVSATWASPWRASCWMAGTNSPSSTSTRPTWRRCSPVRRAAPTARALWPTRRRSSSSPCPRWVRSATWCSVRTGCSRAER